MLYGDMMYAGSWNLLSQGEDGLILDWGEGRRPSLRAIDETLEEDTVSTLELDAPFRLSGLLLLPGPERMESGVSEWNKK
jgi:hypothetical protein